MVSGWLSEKVLGRMGLSVSGSGFLQATGVLAGMRFVVKCR